VAVLIDSSLLVAFERGGVEPDVVVEDAAISVITVSELVHGVLRASAGHRARRQALVEHYLGQFEILAITEPIARVHGAISAELSARGTTVGAHDLWIGATALGYGYGVITRNERDFARIPGLRVVAV
jgi:tRNA(fMet)-specific endonuclease VapC